MNITTDGRRMFPGEVLFNLRSTRGLPLDFALDRIINERGLSVEWLGFVNAARRNGWKDYQTFTVIEHALQDAGLTAEMKQGITDGIRRYMLGSGLHAVT